MLTKRLTKIGDSTGLVIDRPLLDLLGLDRGDEVQIRVENRPSASAMRRRPAPPCGVSSPRTIRLASRTARGDSATPDLAGDPVHRAGDLARIMAARSTVPALEGDL
jgi:hypothetical protein